MMGLLLLLAQEGGAWDAAGHSIRTAWLELVGHYGAVGMLAFFTIVVLRAVLRRDRYRAVSVLTPSDLDAIHAEVTAAEKRTVGEILPVVVERSDAHPGACWASGVFVALLGCALLAPLLPWDRPLLLVACQLLLGGLGAFLAARLPDYKRFFIRESRAQEMVEEQALQEFFRHGLWDTEARTGVLLFISLLERRVVVLADEGITGKVAADQWERTDRAILDGIASGALRDGIIAGIRSAAEVLEEHFPWAEGDRDEIPNRVIVRRE